MEQTLRDLITVIKEATEPKRKAYDTEATVTRVEGSTLWVHIPGGVDETPIKKTINAKPGDTVQIRVGGRKAWVTGNATAPPTDDTAVNHFAAKVEKTFQVIDGSITKIFKGIGDINTLVRESIAGVEVGKVNGAGEYIAGHTLINAETNTYDVVEKDGTTIASFGKESVIGDASGVHTRFDDDSLEMSDGIDAPFVHLGGADLITITEKFSWLVYDEIELSHEPSKIITLTSRGTELVEGTDYTVSGKTITFTQYKTDLVVTYSYIPPEGMKFYTLGKRATGSGGWVVFLERTGDVGEDSYAEGSDIEASGECSHAEGKETGALGECSHAEGYRTTAKGNYSHAGGLNTIADEEAMTALGRYNRGGDPDCLFVVGNGIDEAQPSDAFKVETDGTADAQTGFTVGGDPILKVVSPVNLGSVTLAAGGYTSDTETTDVSASIPSGYSLLCPLFRGSGGNSISMYYLGHSGSTVGYRLKNHGSSSITVTPTVHLLCIKSGMM
jgi:hypothetical protein